MSNLSEDSKYQSKVNSSFTDLSQSGNIEKEKDQEVDFSKDYQIENIDRDITETKKKDNHLGKECEHTSKEKIIPNSIFGPSILNPEKKPLFGGFSEKKVIDDSEKSSNSDQIKLQNLAFEKRELDRHPPHECKKEEVVEIKSVVELLKHFNINIVRKNIE
jgi:hypothetical protein